MSSVPSLQIFFMIFLLFSFVSAFSFLVIGKTQESKDKQEFKRYIGVASSYVVAVNPSKKELDEIRGFESQNEPEYIKDTENGKEAFSYSTPIEADTTLYAVFEESKNPGELFFDDIYTMKHGNYCFLSADIFFG